jgi:Protein of unknown function (DUF3631)
MSRPPTCSEKSAVKMGPPTILFDEIDTIFGPKAKENEEIRGLLNAGHRKGAVAGRCVVRGKTVTTEEISAYCAVALAGLGWLPDTILTRSIIVRMRRRAPHEKVTPFRRKVYASEGHKLRDQLATWAAKSIRDMAEARPVMPDGIEDRNADVWEAPFAIADAAAEHWPKRARVAAVALVAAMAEREPSLGIRLLSDLRDIRGQTEQMTTAVILDRLHSIQEAPWNDLKGKPLNDRGLAYRLREYGVKSRTLNLGGENRAKGYVWEDLHDAWQRYLPPLPSAAERSVTNVTSVPEPDFQGSIVTDGTDAERSGTDEEGEENPDDYSTVTHGTDGTDVAGNGGEIDTDALGPGWWGVDGESVVCAQCHDPGEPLFSCSSVEGIIPLHQECQPFWFRRHPQPKGAVITCVTIETVPSPAIAASISDDIEDIIAPRWRS